ncbi:hypothetical protein BDW22DRAFT_499942 [Trametopsis cervina]|nr:hypothetical protein BDW22DRAFT_499942 [Trametopsis cervina]
MRSCQPTSPPCQAYTMCPTTLGGRTMLTSGSTMLRCCANANANAKSGAGYRHRGRNVHVDVYGWRMNRVEARRTRLDDAATYTRALDLAQLTIYRHVYIQRRCSPETRPDHSQTRMICVTLPVGVLADCTIQLYSTPALYYTDTDTDDR